MEPAGGRLSDYFAAAARRVVVPPNAKQARCLVHQYRQAPKRERQFTPLYLDADTNSVVPRVKPTKSMEALIVTVSLADVVAFGPISATNYSESLFIRIDL